MSVNIPLLRKYVEWVEEQSDLASDNRQWNQGTWFRTLLPSGGLTYAQLKQLEIKAQVEDCGSLYCVAGKIAHDAGFVIDHEGFIQGLLPGVEATDERIDHVVKNNHCALYARSVLGLSEGQAESLFEGSNTAKRVRVLAERFAGERL